MKRKSLLILLVAAMFMMLAACGNGKDKDTIVISGKKWTEQYILPHLLAEYIKAHSDYNVEVKEALGEVNILTPALDKGDIDMYVEYTGTGLGAVLKEDFQTGQSADQILEKVRKGYKDKYNVEWLEPLGFENTYTLALQGDTPIKAKTFSDLIPHSKDLVFGGPHEFYERADGYDAFVKAYGFHFKDKKSIDPNIMYQAVKDGDVDVIPAFTTDGRIERYKLKTLTDDKKFFPPYYAAPVVREETLKKYPKLKKVVNELAGKISEEDMRSMNAKVDIDKKDPADVAKEFLKSKGLID